MKTRYIFLLLFAVVVLSACATAPKFDATGIDPGITPQRAVVENEVLQGAPVLWGGIIITSTNLKDVTQFEILAYPLDSSQRPDAEKTPLGRFLAQQQGYLETADYTQGRFMTVSGILQGKSIGHIGESEYTYPVLKITQYHLWPNRSDTSEPRFHFGVGVSIHK